MSALRRSLAALACLLPASAQVPARSPAPRDAPRPNVVLCMSDDQGWGDVGYNGHPWLRTPNLDRLAREGLRFDRFHAASPICSPARGSVLTGRHPNRFGCFTFGHVLRPQEITLAERLRDAGYATGHFGKWHLGSVQVGSPVNPGASGFERWLSAPNHYDNDPILSREGRAVRLGGESSMVTAEAAVAFIEEQVEAGRPFLAVVWFGSPHGPHHAAPIDKTFYRDKDWEGQADWGGEITGVDRAVGRLRNELRRLGVADDTLFWFCSDNGGLVEDSSGGRGRKGTVYQGGLRVPALLAWPARYPEPLVTDLVASTVDIFPTVLAAAGLEVPAEPPLDGVDLLPLLEGGIDVRPTPLGFWEYPAKRIKKATGKIMTALLAAQRQGVETAPGAELHLDAAEIGPPVPTDRFPGHAAWLDWPFKLHRVERAGATADAPPSIALELYDLDADPLEAHDLAAREDRAERVAAMRAQLETWLASVARSLNGADHE